jgi:fluoride ion exporter CrcB/FEX
MLQTLFLIFIGGGTGSMARYGMMNLISHQTGSSAFPGTRLALILSALLSSAF